MLARCSIYGSAQDALTLIKYGADPFERVPELHWKVLHQVIFFNVEDAYLALFPLFQAEMGVEIPDAHGWTLLHRAIEAGNKTIIRHLIENGADWKAETLPSFNEEPQSIQGIPVSPTQIALAYGETRYLEFLDILDEALGLDPEGGGEGPVWYDAIEYHEVGGFDGDRPD